MNKKFVLIGIVSISLIVGIIGTVGNYDKKSQNDEMLDITDQNNFLFKAFVSKDSHIMQEGQKVWSLIRIEPDPEKTSLYQELESPGNTVVILPIFTASAYKEPGFYTFYRGECDSSCLTTPIVNEYQGTSSVEAIQVFEILKYKLITDLDVETNPDILNEFDKVILLHSEYVTKREFDAITNHPKVVYLYPNALYAEVKVNDDNTITLIRGHNYPEQNIRNAFDWEFDNSPLEYDDDCSNMKFEPNANGVMLNCMPENEILTNPDLLRFLKNY